MLHENNQNRCDRRFKKASVTAQITTIIPTYKRPEKLRKAIQSVLEQTYPHFQVWIYDNASGDSTASIVEEFAKKDPRVKYHCHPKNIGAAENFQYGLSHVKTPFFSFLSDDDYLLPEFYETAMRGLERFPDAALLAAAVIDVNESQEMIDVVLSRWPDQEYFSPQDGLIEVIKNYSNWVGVLFRQEVVAKVGTLDLNLKAIDLDYILRIAARFPLIISKKLSAVFVRHSLSYSGNNIFKLIWPGWPIMIAKLEKNKELPCKVRLEAERLLTRQLRNLLLINVIRALGKKRFEEAQASLRLLSGPKIILLFLAVIITICKTVPAAQKLLVLFLQMRLVWIRRVQKAHLNQECIKALNVLA